jgi:hypothetical protein
LKHSWLLNKKFKNYQEQRAFYKKAFGKKDALLYE